MTLTCGTFVTSFPAGHLFCHTNIIMIGPG